VARANRPLPPLHPTLGVDGTVRVSIYSHDTFEQFIAQCLSILALVIADRKEKCKSTRIKITQLVDCLLAVLACQSLRDEKVPLYIIPLQKLRCRLYIVNKAGLNNHCSDFMQQP
jgi:hypothetical protein